MAVDMFLKLDGIKGEATDKDHKEEIDIASFSWGASQTAHGSGGGGGAGKVSVHDISVTKNIEKSTPELFKACCEGKHIKEATITVRKAGGTPVEYYKLKLTDVLITGVQTAGHEGGDLLTENVTLNFAKFQLDYQEQGPDGKAKGGPVSVSWNIKENTK